MNFKEAYQKEMDNLQCPEELIKRVLEEAENENKRKNNIFYKRRKGWRIESVAIILVFIFICAINGNKIAGFANSILGSFTLQTGKEFMVFDNIEPITFNKEAFINDNGTKIIGGENYWQYFENYKAMNDIVEFKLPAVDKLEYKDISLSLHILGEGHLSTRIIYHGYEFGINGIFATGDYHPKELGYGENRKTEEVYSYADGRKAYFIRVEQEKGDGEEREVVYFLEENILFQMYFDVEKINIVKEILMVLSENE